MQLAQNKRRDTLLIAEFRDFLERRSPFSNTRIPSSRRAAVMPGARRCQASALSLALALDCSPLANDHPMLSNRQTYGKLELSVNHTKQTSGPLSNRHRYAFLATSNRQSGHLASFRSNCNDSSQFSCLARSVSHGCRAAPRALACHWPALSLSAVGRPRRRVTHPSPMPLMRYNCCLKLARSLQEAFT